MPRILFRQCMSLVEKIGTPARYNKVRSLVVEIGTPARYKLRSSAEMRTPAG